MNFKNILFSIFLVAISTAFASGLHAQENGSISGTVTDQKTGETLPGVNVWLENTNRGTSTDSDGQFKLDELSAGFHELVFSFVGYKKQTKTVSVSEGDETEISIALVPNPVMLEGIRVTALRPDQIANEQLESTDVREANPRDSGELMRNIAGVDAVRRGPVGLDPVVRGLRESEVGTYLDGTRIFPGGPARMDSPLSHLDPSAIETIEVVKGPYALNWGAGNMSAVRVETKPLSSIRKPFEVVLNSGYDSNLNAIEQAVSFQGSQGKFGYWLHGAWREGNDYESGNGSDIPADFLSRELRGKLGYDISNNSQVNFSMGYQNQKNIDYPGRLLNADFFNTYNYSLNWSWNPGNGPLTALKANAYINNVDHGMDNDEKPTAQPNPNRTPPFALDIGVDSKTDVRGGKLSAELDISESWDLETGFDIYSANREATRTIDRRDEGMKPPAFPLTDLMWPDATITDAGFYTKANHRLSDKLSASGTVRIDFVSADANTISQFFAENVSTDLDATETNLNGSLTLSYLPIDNWTIGVGLGSVVRTADATERYSDRIPASKAQTSAEFVGNPSLDPERSTQGDLWIDASYPRWSLSVNAFGRHMDNYITLTPTDLPKRLPLSPETVFQYINGEAVFWGFDISTSYRLLNPLRFKTTISYLWGEDTSLDEPALGVAPFSLDAALRYEAEDRPLYIEGGILWVSKQDRVAVSRGETPTDRYVTSNLQAGMTFWQMVSLQAGVKNITDNNYVNHLNAKNPFTGMQLPEPGRLFFADITVRF